MEGDYIWKSVSLENQRQIGGSDFLKQFQRTMIGRVGRPCPLVIYFSKHVASRQFIR